MLLRRLMKLQLGRQVALLLAVQLDTVLGRWWTTLRSRLQMHTILRDRRPPANPEPRMDLRIQKAVMTGLIIQTAAEKAGALRTVVFGCPLVFTIRQKATHTAGRTGMSNIQVVAMKTFIPVVGGDKRTEKMA
jgi:hypothetical protein